MGEFDYISLMTDAMVEQTTGVVQGKEEKKVMTLRVVNEIKMSVLDDVLGVDERQRLNNMNLLRIEENDSEVDQLRKMNLIDSALEYSSYPREQITQKAVEMIPNFGSNNPEFAENPENEAMKVKLWKKALDNNDYGFVRATAVNKLANIFSETDSDSVLESKMEVVRHALESKFMDVRRAAINDLSFGKDDSYRITKLKNELIEIALKSEDEEVRKIAERKSMAEVREPNAEDFLESLLIFPQEKATQ